MLQVVKYNILLYADDSWLVSQHRDFKKIVKLNKNFESICYCFVDNKLSTHFCDDKSKSLFFATKFKNKKKLKKIIKDGDIQIKQHSKVKYSDTC